MNLSHCLRFNGYARLSIPSRFFGVIFGVTNIIVSNNVIAFAECSTTLSVIFDIVSLGTVPAAISELLMFQST